MQACLSVEITYFLSLRKSTILIHKRTFPFLWIFALFKGWKPNEQNSEFLKLQKLLVTLKLISRKIWMTEKSWNFHTVILRTLEGQFLRLWRTSFRAVRISSSSGQTFASIASDLISTSSPWTAGSSAALIQISALKQKEAN